MIAGCATFYLVRHAHADWAADENRPLSAQGHAAAADLVDILQQYPVGAIYSSPFRRARETIAPLAERLALPVIIEPDLQERRLGDFKPRDFFAAVEATWRDPTFAFPGGEPNATAGQRGLAFLLRLQQEYPDEQVVLSTHGNLLALILQSFDSRVDFEFWKSLTMPDLYRLSFGQAGEVDISRLM